MYIFHILFYLFITMSLRDSETSTVESDLFNFQFSN